MCAHHLGFVGGTENQHHKCMLCTIMLFLRDIPLLCYHKPLSPAVRASLWRTETRMAAADWHPRRPQHGQGAVGLPVISSASFAALSHSSGLFFCFCESWLGGREGGEELCALCFVPFITMQTIYGCSQGRSGIPALFPGFLLVH